MGSDRARSLVAMGNRREEIEFDCATEGGGSLVSVERLKDQLR